MKERVGIVGSLRLPFCRMGTAYVDYSAVDLLAETVTHLVDHFDLKKERLGEVVLGTVFQHPTSWNFAREVLLQTPLSPETPALTVSRACATSLDAALVIANKISAGQMDVAIAGGAEAMSDLALFLPRPLARRFIRSQQAKGWGDRFKIWSTISPKEIRLKTPPPVEPTTGLLMGEHAEAMAKQWKISREEQDQLALESHQKGAAAYARGFYRGLVTSFAGVEKDSILRSDTSLERLSRLKPAFDKSEKGTLTAGNSSPLTDGAGCVLLASEKWAKERGLPIQAFLTEFETAAVDPKKEGLLMAPAYAVPRMIRRSNTRLQDFDFYEIHEAFSAQVLCTLKAWQSESFFRDRGLGEILGDIDRRKLNVAGGSVALGHPFGATGARVLGTLAKLLEEKGGGKALGSICTGGGMGTVCTLER